MLFKKMVGKMCIVEDALLINKTGDQEIDLIKSADNKEILNLSQSEACSESDN